MSRRPPIPRTTAELDVAHVDVPQGARSEHAESVAVGDVHDPLEADADRLAETALRVADDVRPGATIQRSSDGSRATNGLHVRRKALDRAASDGRPLDASQRARFEGGLGTDLGDVRIHTSDAAADTAAQIDARAFTHGNDVFFGKGEYRPGTADGDRVLAHELSHTAQQSSDIHRFPATWGTSPVPWKGQTASVFRPGEGASGGVYILTSKDDAGPVKKAVAKPVFGENGLGLRESGQQLQFSDEALAKLLGLNAPESKVVTKGGTEFQHLVDVCQPKQPAPDPGEQAVPLSQAESFVVMSEVPNASSIASMADKAPTDKRAAADLHRAVFDPRFLTELGKLCIGDLMVGNPDRIVLGAMNLGNVMVSMQEDGARLAAIDTTAYLPKTVQPEDWGSSGGSAGGGFSHTKSALNKGPGEVLDGFFEVLVNRLKRGTPDTESGAMPPTWAVIESTYKNNRDYFLASFDFGWNDAMITALSLSHDRSKVAEVASKYDDQDVTTDTLMANLSYIGSRATGASHEDSIGRSVAISSKNWVHSLDFDRMAPRARDSLAASAGTVPTGKALTAEVVAMPHLPKPSVLGPVTNKYGNSLSANDYPQLAKWPSVIDKSHSDVDNAVSATKKRRKRPFGRKEDQPRNRSVVGHYIVHSTALGAGGARMADAAAYVHSVASQSQSVVGGDYRGNEDVPVINLLNHLGTSVSVLATHITQYKRHLAQAPSIVESTRHGERAGLAQALRDVDVYLDKALDKLGKVKNMRLQQQAAALKNRPKV